MTKVVRFNVVNTEPVELRVDQPSIIDQLSGAQLLSLWNALRNFLSVTPLEDKEFFIRAVEQGAVYFSVPANGSEASAMNQAESAQD